MRHFYDHWVGNKDSVRQKEFEAIVDTFARPDAIKASLGWYRATCEEESSPSAHAPEDPISIPTVVRWRDLDPVKPASWAEGREETVSVIRTAVSMAR